MYEPRNSPRSVPPGQRQLTPLAMVLYVIVVALTVTLVVHLSGRKEPRHLTGVGSELPTNPENQDLPTSRLTALNESRFADARALARECLGPDPQNADCHHVLTNSFTRKGEYGAELTQAIDDCLSVLPDEPHAWRAKC